MTSRTPWVGSLPSERIPPKPAPQQRQNRNEGKKTSTNSPEVQKLEDILNGLRREDTKDPTDGCFCQARTHSLAKYTPNCLNCGLVLCALQLPFHLCPHCSISLLTSSSRDTLANQIEEEITHVLQKEEEDRIRERQEREKAAGAFPTLAAATGTPEHRTTAQSRGVMSINSKARKVMVASYVTSPPQSSSSLAAPSKKKEVREPRPPGEIDYVKGMSFDPTIWKNLRNSSCVYVPLPPSPKKTMDATQTHRPKKTKKIDIDIPTISSTSQSR